MLGNWAQWKHAVLKIFTDDDIAKIADTVQAWKSGEGYEDTAGFCASASLEEIEKNGFMLTPGRYVGMVNAEEDSEPFAQKLNRLTQDLQRLHTQADSLDKTILHNLNKLRGIIND